MTREQYLQMRHGDPLLILYEYYKENFDSSKHRLFLPPNQFFQFMFMWPGSRTAIQNIVNYYDELFTIVTLSETATGKIIKIL